MEVLEERNDVLILLDKDDRVQVLEKNPYNLLKHKYYLGKKIRFVSNSEDKLSIEETNDDGMFLCTFDGITVSIADYVKTAAAILEAQSTGNLLPILSLWKQKHIEKFLEISIVLDANSTLELAREGKLFLPKHVGLSILEWQERLDGGRVVKVEFSRGVKSPVDRIFTHEIRMKKGQTRIAVNETAVSLIGRDETGQLWMHVVPPEYRNRSISSCEMWLCGGEDKKDELVDIRKISS